MAPIQFTRGGSILLLLCVVFILKNEKTSAENAAFNVCKMIIKDSTCNFTISAHSVSGVTGYKIEFGDGNSVSFTDRTKVTSNAYNKVGVYTATLTFEGSTGPVKVAKTVTVREALVNATIQMTSFLCIVGKSISFSAIASPNISTDAYYKLGNSKWLSGNTMMCNETGYHGLLIFIENGVSAILFKCLVNITAVKSDLTWVPPVGAVNQSVTFTPSVTPAIDVSFLYIFLDNVVVNCSNSSVGYAFDDANLNPGHPVQVVITDSKKNSAQFTKNVPIAFPLVGPLKITCPGFVGIDLLASFSVSLTESNVSFIYNFGDNTTAVSIPQNTTTHTFSRQGRYTVKITAKGLVNEISSTCDVTVVESIQGLSCAQDVIATPLGNSTALGWVIENGTDFTIKFQINPSLPTYQVVNLSASDLLVVYKQHNYTAVGEYLVNLYAWNIVSNVSTFCRVLVQEAITYVNATIISPLDCIEMNQDVTVVVQSDGTTPLYEYDFDGNNTAYNTTSNSVSHKWTMYGNYTLRITARNNVSSKVFLKPVFVPKPVMLLNQIEIDTKVTNLTTKSKLVMRLGQGSDFKCNISWGPTLNTSLYCYNHTYFADKKSLNTTPFQNLVLSEEYVYPETGCFVVNVYCYNRRSNVTGTTTACVQKPITNFLPVPTIPQINGENFMVNFSMTAGTNVTVRGTMNDVDISPYAFVTDTNGSLIVQYSVHYKQVGHFSLDFFAKNLVSEVNSTSVIVTVQEAITELKCNVTSHYAFSQAGIQPGCTNKTDTFAAEYNITMNATPNKGTNLTCYYTLGDGRTVNTSSLSVEHKYSPEYKNYTTTVTCSNLVSSVTCAFPISMQKTVKSLTVTNNGPKKFKKPITFTLNVADFGTGTCFTLDYVDGTAIDVLGPDHCKLLTFPQGQTYISLAESSSFIATHPFDQVDEYYVKVNATNEVSCMATVIQAVAVLKECHYPNVSIIGAAENVTQANFYYKSEVVQLVAHTEVFCEVSNKTNYTWTIVKVKDFNNDTIDPPQEVIISGTSFTLSKLTILQRSLTYGVYKVSVTVYMSETVGVKTVKEAYFGISCTPYLEVKIKEGKVLKRTIGSPLTFNGSPSYDPDHGTDIYRNMTFYWFCRKKKEAQPNIHSPENVPLITIPNKNTKASTLTNGGCFGTGVGRLPLNSMTFSLDTSLPGIESGADNSLVVTLVVVKNDSCGVRVQNFDQYVELTKEGVPDLSTQCTLNCKREVNVNEKTSFKATCTGCNSQTIYKWSCKELKSCAEDPTDPKNTLRALTDEDFENLLYGKVSDFHIVFKEGKLEGGKCYFVTLKATNPARRRKRAVDSSQVGENAFLMETNKPPEKGSLVISPMVGYAMNTSFTFGFSNWQDTNIPLTYSCGIWDGINFQLIETTGEEEIQMMLPAGDQAKNYNVTVRCKVTDRQGAATILDKQLQVRPANDEYSLLSFLVLDKDGALNQAVEKGDFAAILKISISVGEMLYKLNEANEDSLKGNITDAEKQKIEGRVEEIQKAQAEVITKLTLVKVDMMQDAEVLASALNGITKSYSSLDDQSQEKALMVMSTLKDLVVSANPLDQSFSSLKDTCAQLTSCFGQIASASAKTATYNSTETMFDITGSSKNPNITGMVSNRESAKVRVQAILKMTIDVNKLLLSNQLPGEAQLHLYSDTLNTTLAKVFVKDLGQASIGDGRTSVSLPPGEGMGMKLLDSTKDNIGCAVSSFLNPIITWTNTSNLIKSQLVDINMFGDGGKLLTLEGFTTPARIDVPRDAGKIPALENRFMRKYKANAEFDQYLQFHEVKLTSRDMANHLQIIPRNQTISLGVYIQFGERAYPEEGKFLYNWTVPDFSSCKLDDINETRMVGDHQVYMVDPDKYCDIDPYTVFITYDLLQKLGTIYITIAYTSFKDPPPTEAPRKRRAIPGVPCGSHGGRMKRSCVFIPPPPPTPPTEPPWGALVEVDTKNPLEDLMGNLIDLNNTIQYDVRIFQTNCLFFNETAQAYLNYGCKVSNKTRKDKVVCLCNHFTSFGSDFFVAPNPIDFDKVFSADLSKNPVVLSVVCGLFGLYLILVVFARRADKRDEKKTGVTPLPANAAPGSHSFLISIHTGVRMNAGTTANVYVVLSGEEGEAPPVLLTDPERPLFTRGADNALVMTIPKDVGKITHLRVWHDNTGLSPSWYLSRIALEDLHNHNKVYFVCERWLAVEEDDGRVDRIIPVASDKELTQFNHLFVSKTVRELGDGHLWFSIIARPPQSVFTRVQRLSVALSLLYCTMITSCMFYNTGGQKEDPTYILYLGSLKIDLKQMIIGLQSSLIVFPVNLAFMQIFRNIRPDEPNTEKAEDITEGFDDVCEDDDMKDLEKKKKKKKEKKGLHPKWRYVAWAICALSTIASASFTVFYSLSWGPETANKWMIAFVLSFFQSVLLIQPVKVIFAAIVFALIIKKPIENEEESNKDEVAQSCTKNIPEKPMMSDDYMFSDGTRVGPPDELMLMAARQKRLKEIRMQIILREIIAFFMFMAVLLLVAYGNRDPNAYLLRKSLYDSFVNPGVGDKVPFNGVGDVDSFWFWTRETLLPTLYPGPWYNGQKDKYKGFLDDRHNYLVGISRLRQERVKPDTCTVVPIMRHIFPTCYGQFSMSNIEDRDFDTNWKYLNKSKTAAKRKRRSVQEQLWFVGKNDKLVEYDATRKILKRKRRAIDPVYKSDSGRQARKRDRGASKTYTILETAILPDGSIMSCPTRWQYHTMFELRGFPYWGMLNFYGGGGYPADLGYDYSTAMTVIADTNSHNWLDVQSRAVFNEFTIYNANTNLFAAAFLFMEFLPDGGAFSTANFVVSRLYSYVGPFAKLILAMEVIMLVFMFYFMYREFKLMYKQGMAYFHGFWNWIEVILIVLEFVMTILFFARMWETDKNFIKLHHNPKDFVSFQYATAADQTLTYVIGFLVFLVTLRFLKLLRFNKKMAFIGTTISVIAKPIGLFMISFSVVFASYNCFGVLIFGAASDYYKDNVSAAVTQMRILLGDFDYFELTDIEPILGPLYFFTYMYLIVFFLMNMFLAIINDSFSEVKELEDKLSNEYEMVEFIMERLKNQMAFMKRGNPSQVKTPYGPGSAVPFWEYKRRKSSISSDSEFSCTTNLTAIKAKRDLKLMEDDLSDLIKRLSEMEVEDVESDEAFIKVAQNVHSRGDRYSDSESDAESDAGTQFSNATKSGEDDALSRSTDLNTE